MQEVEVAKIKAGMVLAEPAADMMGNPLFEKGTVLKPREIKTLKAWGVHSVFVDRIVKLSPKQPEKIKTGRRRKTTQILRASTAKIPATAEKEKPEGEPSAESRIKELEHMFAPHKGNELMEKIREIALSQLERKL